MSKDYKLDIFDVLGAIDTRDQKFLERQAEDAKNGFLPRVVLRWAGTVPNGQLSEHYIAMMNEFVNIDFDALRDHPELQYRLMAMCGAGRRTKHEWIPMPKQQTLKTSPKIAAHLAQFFPLANSTELEFLLSQFTRETFTDFIAQTGCSPKETKELIDAYDKAHGKKKAKGKKG